MVGVTGTRQGVSRWVCLVQGKVIVGGCIWYKVGCGQLGMSCTGRDMAGHMGVSNANQVWLG